MGDNEIIFPQLPEGWLKTTLGVCTEIIQGQSPPSSTYNESGNGLPFYQGKLEFGSIYPTPRKWCDKPKKIALEGYVLISVRAPVGPTNICREKSCIGRGLAAIRSLNGMEPFFILYLLRASESEIAGKGTGTTFKAITGKQLRDFIIPLPPLPEQHRIVARIEQLFTNLDAGMESLKAVRTQLKRYRQSVLKSACDGRLVPTEAELARAEGREYEPAEMLLERILEERRRKWEENKKGKRYKEAALPDMTEMSELPEGWCWVTLEQYSFEVKDGTHDSPKYQLSGIPFVTQKNIKHSGLNFSKMNYISIEDHNNFYRRSNPTRGDIIISMIGANRGMSCIVNVDTVFSIKNVGLVKPYKFYNSIKFLDIFMKSPVGQRIILEKSRGGAQSFIGLTELRGWLISLPPLAEQHRIVAEVERRLSVADEMEKTIEQSLKQAERLRQSILKRAFEGKLVPQDPEDEPAGVLLEKIKDEKAQREKVKVKRKVNCTI
jgi:type I restriction enzyme S subunit